MRGIIVRAVERTRASGSKTDRFLQLQPLVASKLISFTKSARHVDMCLEHMSKITANNTHRHDDIADTCYDACKIALIDKTIYSTVVDNTDRVDKFSALSKSLNKRLAAGNARNG
jgi:phage terminase large subunit-like protein